MQFNKNNGIPKINIVLAYKNEIISINRKIMYYIS